MGSTLKSSTRLYTLVHTQNVAYRATVHPRISRRHWFVSKVNLRIVVGLVGWAAVRQTYMQRWMDVCLFCIQFSMWLGIRSCCASGRFPCGSNSHSLSFWWLFHTTKAAKNRQKYVVPVRLSDPARRPKIYGGHPQSVYSHRGDCTQSGGGSDEFLRHF